MKGPGHKRAKNSRRVWVCPQSGREFTTSGAVVSQRSAVNSEVWCRVEDRKPVDQPMDNWEQLTGMMMVEPAPEDGETEFVSANLPLPEVEQDSRKSSPRRGTKEKPEQKLTPEKSESKQNRSETPEQEDTFGEGIGLEVSEESQASSEAEATTEATHEKSESEAKPKKRRRRRSRRRKPNRSSSGDQKPGAN